jgi:hypothetical protein
MGYIGAIISAVGAGIKLIGSATSSPNYPSMPKLYKLPVQEAKQHLEDYEKSRMAASIDAWKQRFPELYKGGQYEVDDIKKQQQGYLGGHIDADMKASGLQPIKEGNNQYDLSRQIGLNPLTLSQRTSQAVTRQIASNPEWTNKITGGTLATMLANNAQNATAYGMMKSANQTAQYVAGKQAGLFNTQALLGGLTGAARIGSQIYNNSQYGPLSAAGQGAFQQNPNTIVSTYNPYQTNYPAAAPTGPSAPPPNYNNSYWGVNSDPYYANTPQSPMMMGQPATGQSNMYSNQWDNSQFSNLFMPTGG